MSDSPVALDLERESTTAPAERELPYVQVGACADVIGGASVFLSRNRKRVAAIGDKAPICVTSQDGTVQQSIPYRAIASALTHDVIPMVQVVTRYAKAGRLAELHELALTAMAAATEPEPEPEPEPELADEGGE